ncbi:hypothetical protein [Pseudomonas sivasensis]|uniref:hypothetical protein n=1 Tax=Pseudomonas sivasensis TaxID=1880678 RepID=UPI000F06E633|nr:hypothetical protein [Pseudomonas sivasensis]
MKPEQNARVKEIEFHIKLGEIDHTIVISPSITLKNGKLLINGSRLVLGGGPAGGLHTFEARITDGLSPGNYSLDNGSNNLVDLVYIAPKTNILNSFHSESGSFYLNTTATIERIDATFNCVAKNVNPLITEEAYLSLGKIAFHQPLEVTTTGELTGTIEPGNSSFTPKTFSMQFVEAPDHPGFLTLDAAVGNQRLFVHIPKAKLGDGTTQTLPINKDESGKSALSTLLYGDVYHAESGEITFNYNEHTQTLTGDIIFQATGTNAIPTKITFSSKAFKVTGLDV